MTLSAFRPCRLLAATLLLTATGLAAAQNESGRQQLSLDDLRTFVDVFEQLRRNYVVEIDDRTLLDAAIRGMLDETDTYSAFLTAEEFLALEESVRGEFGGIGVEITIRDRRLELQTVQSGGPADQAGLRPGDLILAVDGQVVRGRKLEDSIAALRGAPGSEVSVAVQSPGESPREVQLSREMVAMISVEGERYENGIGYLRISQFHDGTVVEFQQRLADLQSGPAPLTGLIIDLRGNLGGQLQAAVGVADGLLDEGLITRTVSRYPATRLEFHAHEGTWVGNIPVAVLVDATTASASEVLAGALQDHRRATIVGQKTFGKGVVQSMMRLRNGAALRITTAHYYTPAGRSLQGTGIEPDIETGAAEDTLGRARSWLESGAE